MVIRQEGGRKIGSVLFHIKVMTEIRYAKCGNKFLLQVKELIDWRRINAYLNRKYTKCGGTSSLPGPLMFKILPLGIWYSLSDEAWKNALMTLSSSYILEE